jgi:hypothetical protein
MPNDNLLKARHSKTGEVIDWLPILVMLNHEVGEYTISYKEALELPVVSRFDEAFRQKLTRLLSDGYKVPEYVMMNDYWALTGYWLCTPTWSIHISFAPGDRGSHFYCMPQKAAYPWERTAFLARVTWFREGIHYGTKEFATPEEVWQETLDLIG